MKTKRPSVHNRRNLFSAAVVTLGLILLGIWYSPHMKDMRNILGLSQTNTSTPTPVPNPIPDTPVQKSVFLLIFNPILENYGNFKLTQYKNWSDPDTLTSQLLTALNQVSHGYITYSIKERQEVDGIPLFHRFATELI